MKWRLRRLRCRFIGEHLWVFTPPLSMPEVIAVRRARLPMKTCKRCGIREYPPTDFQSRVVDVFIREAEIMSDFPNFQFETIGALPVRNRKTQIKEKEDA